MASISTTFALAVVLRIFIFIFVNAIIEAYCTKNKVKLNISTLWKKLYI